MPLFDNDSPIVYVDQLRNWGWRIRGRVYESCHMFVACGTDIEVLHTMAERIGLKREWFQNHTGLPHYDLIPSKRSKALLCGAKHAEDRFMVDQMREYTKRFVDKVRGC